MQERIKLVHCAQYIDGEWKEVRSPVELIIKESEQYDKHVLAKIAEYKADGQPLKITIVNE